MTTSTVSLPSATGIFGLVARAGTVALRLVAVARAYKGRRDMDMLAGFDDRMLADIGLTRGDLRDAAAEPLWHDPTTVLVMRARERRNARRSPAASRRLVDAPPIVPGGVERPWFPLRARYY